MTLSYFATCTLVIPGWEFITSAVPPGPLIITLLCLCLSVSFSLSLCNLPHFSRWSSTSFCSARHTRTNQEPTKHWFNDKNLPLGTKVFACITGQCEGNSCHRELASACFRNAAYRNLRNISYTWNVKVEQRTRNASDCLIKVKLP